MQITQLSLSQTMFVLPCSRTKSSSITTTTITTSRGSSITDFLPRNLVCELLTYRTRNRVKTGINESTLARAIDRYDGTLYQIARDAIDELIRKGANVLILSGGYGTVLATEPIGMYDSEFRTSMWPERIVERCLAAYAEKVALTTVVGLMSISTGYAGVFRRTEWPSHLSQVLLVTPERGTGAMRKAPRAQGEALVTIARSGELTKGWCSSDGLAMEVEQVETR